MKNVRILRYSAAALACGLALAARGEPSTSTIKFSDPAKPGTVKVALGRGDLWIEGSDTAEVIVQSDAKAVGKPQRKDGLRVLTASSSFSLSESSNVVTLDALSEMSKGGSEFRLKVPRATSVVVQNSWGGTITCSNVDGDIEIKSMNGEIKLNETGGGVLVETMNGEIQATVRELRDNKPLSFTSWNGEVVLRVPEQAKANVRLRTQNGSVLTDFDEGSLVTKTENAAMMPRVKRAVTIERGSRGMSQEVRDAIREATAVGASAVREALEAVREGLEEARVNSEEARKELENAHREIEKARAAQGRVHGKVPTGAPPVPPTPPKAPVPTVTGGKLVTGTLNGGGPEISIATMNGDVTLRKTKVAKE